MPASPRKSRPVGPGRPKDLEKRAAILAAAKRLFPARGFDGVSMDAIAAEAGVSKLTVYSHFRDKEALFAAAVREKCLEQVPEEVFVTAPKGPIRDALGTIAQHFFALVSSDEAMGLQRMILAESGAETRMGKLFWDAGPARILASFERFLHEAVAAGKLEIPDVEEAAGHFLCLLKGEVNMRMIFGPDAPKHCASDERHVASVVDMFLRAYAPRGE
ncbi:MAG TPA: TetR/AcrR family transcriptional regulator [Xanthomonadaceae bacterium]|nr:TetR/AcrR family transcriptional regulator [Xanthomonadaceae bacterium]